jgi:uncharacterized protein
MEKDENPFLVAGYNGPDYFCDRKDETAALKGHIKNNRNVTLFSLRRLGKTGLIHHVFDGFKSNRNIACLYVDILNTLDLKQFTNQLATVIYNRFPENIGIGKKLMEVIRALRPLISYDPLSGTPEVTFDLAETRQYEKTIQQLFTFLDRQNIKVVIAIDEFQQILEYPEKNTEALLRSHMQRLSNTRFIFCGSNQKMMHELFNSAKRPFYASCTNMHLDFIDAAEYEHFILSSFKKHKRVLTPESAGFILDWTMRHTFYTQYFCNFLFASGLKKITLNDVHQNAAQVLKVNESTYYQYRNLITLPQWNLLSAIAQETRLYRAHSKEFISKYGLGTSSMVTRSLEALLEKEMVYHYTGSERPHYEVYDKFLMRWLQH